MFLNIDSSYEELFVLMTLVLLHESRSASWIQLMPDLCSAAGALQDC